MQFVIRLIKPLALLACLALLQACSPSIPKDILESKYSLPSSRYVHIDGNRVHVSEEGNGEAIVLIHGTASSLHTWDQWAKSLAKRFRVIRMDLPGFGLTGPDHQARYEVADDVDFLNQLFQQLAVPSAHLVGSSLGGRIAWEFSLAHPEKVTSLTLMNALGYPQEAWPPAIQAAQWPVFDVLMTKVSPRFMYQIGLGDVYFDAALIDDVLVDRYFELSRFPGNLAAFPDRVKARLDDQSSKIPQIQVPTLILWGEEDLYFPVQNAHRFHQDIAGSELVVFPEVGHLPMEEVPEESVRAFTQFIQTL